MEKSECQFCKMLKGNIISENTLCYAIRDINPVTEFHTLIIPKRHAPDYFELDQLEIEMLHNIMTLVKDEMISLDSSITGFNIGINTGLDAGQTVFHCHIHLIPRRKGDIDNPQGGVRGVIPEKRTY
jgi:ATP adenylyltransferase